MQDHQFKPDPIQADPVDHLLGKIAHRKDGFEAARVKLLGAALKLVPFDGWTPLMIQKAAQDADLATDQIEVLFPDRVADLLDFWHGDADEAMLSKMSGDEFSSLKIRQKITQALIFRLDYLAPHKEATRRAAATLALPHMAPKGVKLTWRSADRVWQALGDSSLDFNYYSKRTILAGVWGSTLTKWLGDESENHQATLEFLDQRIANVMQFEKWKADWKKRDIDIARTFKEGVIPALAKLRYPGR